MYVGIVFSKRLFRNVQKLGFGGKGVLYMFEDFKIRRKKLSRQKSSHEKSASWESQKTEEIRISRQENKQSFVFKNIILKTAKLRSQHFILQIIH
jgi:hypothetical protein